MDFKAVDDIIKDIVLTIVTNLSIFFSYQQVPKWYGVILKINMLIE